MTMRRRAGMTAAALAVIGLAFAPTVAHADDATEVISENPAAPSAPTATSSLAPVSGVFAASEVEISPGPLEIEIDDPDWSSISDASGRVALEAQFTPTTLPAGPYQLVFDFGGLMDDGTWNTLSTVGLPHYHSIHGDYAVIHITHWTTETLTVAFSGRFDRLSDGDHEVEFRFHLYPDGAVPDPLPGTCDPTVALQCATVDATPELLPSITLDATSVIAGDGEIERVDYVALVRNDTPFAASEVAPFEAVFDVTGLLDDAVSIDTVTPSAGEWSSTIPGRLHWAGPIASGAEVELRFSVVPHPVSTDPADAGDRELRVVAATFDAPDELPSQFECAGDAWCASSVVVLPALDVVEPEALPATGPASAAVPLLWAGLGALVLGALLRVRRTA